jgi:hypothetical protein
MSNPFGKSSKLRHSETFHPTTEHPTDDESDTALSIDLGANVSSRPRASSPRRQRMPTMIPEGEESEGEPSRQTTPTMGRTPAAITLRDIRQLLEENTANSDARHAQDNLAAEARFRTEIAQLRQQIASLSATPLAQEVCEDSPAGSTGLPRARETSVPLSHQGGFANPFPPLNIVPSNVRKTPRFKDPTRLNDNGVTTGPTFKQWVREVAGKFRANADHFEDETAKMNYIYSVVEGEAAAYLENVYGTGADTDLVSADELIHYLGDIYRNPHERQENRQYFKKLQMADKETFARFKAEFIKLAGLGKISKDEWAEEMLDKVCIRLQNAMVPVKWTDFNDLCDNLAVMDGRQQAIREKAIHLRVAKTSTSAVPTTGARIPPRSTFETKPVLPTTLFRPNTGQIPTKVTDKTKVTCYNCRETGHYRNECTKPASARIQALEAQLLEFEENYIAQVGFVEDAEEEDTEDSGKALA